MAILIDENTRILIQGITGASGRGFAARMVAAKTPLVGGVSPGKAGETVEGVPVFDTMADAVRATGATAVLSVIGVANALDAVYEAIEAGIKLIVLYAENVPVHDALKMRALAEARGVRLFGPNSAGVMSPGKANLADLSDSRVRPGSIGIVSKSGTLTYEVADCLDRIGQGVSTVACIGGDRIVGMTYASVLPLFEADPATEMVVLIGEPGGVLEYRAIEVIRTMTTPVLAYVTGQHAPSEKRMGHAGAISGSSGAATTAAAKLQAFRDAGCEATGLLTDIPILAARVLERRNHKNR